MELTPQQKARLRERAARQGKQPADVLTAFLDTPTEEETADASPTWGERTLTALEAEDALGLWQDRPESSAELAAEFRRLAGSRGPLPCR